MNLRRRVKTFILLSTLSSSSSPPAAAAAANNNNIHQPHPHQIMEEKKDTESSSTTTTGLAPLLARPNILSLHPYRCARDDYSTGILLDANENAYGPASLPTNSLNPPDNTMLLERYPCPYQRIIKRLLCDYRNGSSGGSITTDNVFVGVGSDEAIDLLIRIFCAPGATNGTGDAILITPPTYGMYKVCANVNDVSIQSVPLTPDFDVQVEQVLDAVNDKTKLLFLCSPGNPTSKSIPLSVVKSIAESKRYRGFIVVDEAYVDFATEKSATSLVGEYNNIVVLQTLSKAFGLAGIRCGFAIGPPDVIQLMNNVKAPYNVNKLTSDAAANALRNIKVLEGHVKSVLGEREKLKRELEGLEFVEKVYHSDANFLLFRVREKANELYKTMADNGIVSRFRGNELHCNECIRVTIGLPEENAKYLELLKATYAELTK